MHRTDPGDVLAALLDELGEGPLVVDPDVMAGYGIDRATMVEPGQPLAVVRARDTADVQAVLRVAPTCAVRAKLSSRQSAGRQVTQVLAARRSLRSSRSVAGR